nr:hypothetical protein [uncultured Carboxylicivirga sp.]
MKHVPEVKTIDIVLICLYIIWCGILTFGYLSYFFEFDFINTSIQVTGFGSALVLYGAYNTKLRNDKIFLAWFAIGLIQFIIYILYSELPDFQSEKGSILSPIKGLMFSVLIYRGLRAVYYKIFKRELIITGRENSVGDRSFVENRTIGASDFIFSILGAILITFITILG